MSNSSCQSLETVSLFCFVLHMAKIYHFSFYCIWIQSHRKLFIMSKGHQYLKYSGVDFFFSIFIPYLLGVYFYLIRLFLPPLCGICVCVFSQFTLGVFTFFQMYLSINLSSSIKKPFDIFIEIALNV